MLFPLAVLVHGTAFRYAALNVDKHAHDRQRQNAHERFGISNCTNFNAQFWQFLRSRVVLQNCTRLEVKRPFPRRNPPHCENRGIHSAYTRDTMQHNRNSLVWLSVDCRIVVNLLHTNKCPAKRNEWSLSLCEYL